MDFEQKAAKLIDVYKMTASGDKILAAFSGGSDSSALLHFLVKHYGRENIYAAHFNHAIRGNDADADEAFAIKTCEKYGIQIFTERKNVPELAAQIKKSIEEAARDLRYDFFSRICKEIQGNIKIATAHTASDNTESVLINLARGTGLGGLCGIAPISDNIIRPLLLCDKHDVLAYCAENDIDFVEDKSNADELYTRNFIRHSVTSKLKERYSALDSNIWRMSEIMRETADFMDSITEELLKDCDGGLPVNIYIAQHKALRRAVIIKMCRNAGGRNPDFNITEQLDEQLLSGKLVRMDLGKNLAAQFADGKFRIYKEPKDYRTHRKRIKQEKNKSEVEK